MASLSDKQVEKSKKLLKLVKIYFFVFSLRCVWNLARYVSGFQLRFENDQSYYSMYLCYYLLVDVLPLSLLSYFSYII